MAKNFPHLADTEFPYLQDANPYEFKNEFDYSRWNDDVRLKLLSLNVDDSNRCVLDNDMRDSLFDALPGYEFRCVSRVIDGVAKVNVPFETCCKFNYLATRYPIPTSALQPIDNAESDSVRTFLWLIEDMEYAAPNTTVLTLKLDVWATYGDRLSISFMHLDRGHAPMAAISASDFLADPLNNYGELATADVNYGDLARLRSHDLIDYGNDRKFIVFGVSMDADFIPKMVNATPLDSSTWASFENRSISYAGGLSARTAYYYTVDDYYWGYTGKDYNNCLTNTGIPRIVDDIYSDLTYVAIESALAFSDDFLIDLYGKIPHFLKVVEVIFIASERMLSFGKKIKLCGYDAHIVQGCDIDLYDIDLDASMFGYPARYAGIAKLYTSPYAIMRVSDGESEIDIRIQDISKDAKARTKAILNTLDFVTMIEGVSGDAKTDVDIVKLDGSQISAEIPSGLWQRYIVSSQIPTYGIYMSNMQSVAIDSYTSDMIVNRNAAIAAYHAANRGDNCTLHNTNDSATTSVSNCATQTSANTSITTRGNTFNTAAANLNVGKMNDDRAVDAIVNALSGAVSTGSNALSFGASQSAAAQTAGIQLLGDLGTLHLGRAITGQMQYSVSAAQARAEYNIAYTENSALNAASAVSASAKVGLATGLLSDITSAQNSASSDITSLANTAATTQNTRTNNTIKDNARYSFEDSHAAESNALSIEQQRIYGKYRDLKRSGNVKLLQDSGRKMLDSFQLRGIDFQIITQSDGDIARTGDEFLRYGYMYERNWIFNGWNAMQHFTYWKSSDVWFDRSDVPEFAIRTIRDDLRNGITIWRNISDIMKVSIYDNGV